MTSGKKLPPPGQIPANDGDIERRDNAVDPNMERQFMQSITAPAGPDSANGEGLDARLQAQIGHKLKLMFDEFANAPVPDKFLELLRKLDRQEGEK